MKRNKTILLVFLALFGLAAYPSARADVTPVSENTVQVTGELIDSWCYLTEIMYPLGTAHHQCAVWCAAGGIPVGILSDDGTPYILLSFQGDAQTVANPALLDLQTHHVVLEGTAFERDGMHYLVADRLVEDHGIINMTHEDYGIQPFGE